MSERDSSSFDRAARLGVYASIGVFVLALAARTWPFVFHVFRPGELLLFGDSDPYYHLRRIRLAAERFPALADFDPWLDFPHGAYAIWSPLFDWVPAALIRLTGADADLVAVLWPAWLGAGCVVVLHRIVLRTASPGLALGSAALAALLPGAVLISALGRIDHHVAEVLMQLLGHLQLLRIFTRLEASERVSLRSQLVLGAIFGVALLTWAGSLLFLVVPGACLGLLACVPNERAARYARVARIAFGLAAALIAPYALLNLERGRPAFASVFVSMLHVLLCIVLALAPTAAMTAMRLLRTTAPSAALVRVVSVAALLAAPLLVPSVREGLLDGLAFVSRDQSPWLLSIAEFEPLLGSGRAWQESLAYTGYGMPWLGALAALLVWRCARDRLRSGAASLLALWAVHAFVLAVAQLRFHNYADMLIAATPALFWQAGQSVALHAAARTALRAAAVFSLLSIVPALEYWKPLISGDARAHVAYPQLQFPVFDLLRRMRALEPKPSDPYDFAQRPHDGVFAPWDLGHWLLVIAQRPVVATPFGAHLSGHGYADAEKLYGELRDEASVLHLLEQRRCRWLITSALTASDPKQRSFAQALHATDGASVEHAAAFAGSGRFRRRLATIGANVDGQPAYKVFERVPGALLRFEDITAKTLWLRTRVNADAGPFEHARRADAASSGRGFELRVAYPGAYRVEADGQVVGTIPVTERDVAEGRTLTLRSRPAQ